MQQTAKDPKELLELDKLKLQQIIEEEVSSNSKLWLCVAWTTARGFEQRTEEIRQEVRRRDYPF